MPSEERHHSSRSRHSHYHSDSHRSRSRDSHRSKDYSRHRSSHRDSHRDSHRERSHQNENRSVSRVETQHGTRGRASVRYETIQKGTASSNATGSTAVPPLPSVEVSGCGYV